MQKHTRFVFIRILYFSPQPGNILSVICCNKQPIVSRLRFQPYVLIIFILIKQKRVPYRTKIFATLTNFITGLSSKTAWRCNFLPI